MSNHEKCSRAYRRNKARADRKQARREGRPGALIVWRTEGFAAIAANNAAKITERAVQANAAREAATKAIMSNPGVPPQRIVVHAFLDFYRGEKQTRPVRRIVRDLEQQARQLAKAA